MVSFLSQSFSVRHKVAISLFIILENFIILKNVIICGLIAWIHMDGILYA